MGNVGTFFYNLFDILKNGATTLYSALSTNLTANLPTWLQNLLPDGITGFTLLGVLGGASLIAFIIWSIVKL